MGLSLRGEDKNHRIKGCGRDIFLSGKNGEAHKVAESAARPSALSETCLRNKVP